MIHVGGSNSLMGWFESFFRNLKPKVNAAAPAANAVRPLEPTKVNLLLRVALAIMKMMQIPCARNLRYTPALCRKSF